MKKRIFALLLAVLMVSALFAGCGTASTSSAPGSGSTAQEPTAAPAADPTTPAEPDAAPTDEPEASYFPLAETEELTLWYSYPPFMTNYLDSVSEFQIYQEAAKRLNIELKFTEVSILAAREAVTTMVASGDFCDISVAFFGNYSETPTYCVENDIILNLTDMMQEYAPNYIATLNSDPEYLRQASTDDGSLIFFYYLLTKEGQMDGFGPVVRKDYLDALNLDVPQTYDDYYEVLKAFRTELDGGYFWMPHQGTVDGSAFGSGFGVSVEHYADKYKPFYVIDGQVKYGYLEDGSYEYFTYLNKLYSEGLMYPDFMVDTSNYLYPEEGIAVDGTLGVFFTTAKNLDQYFLLATDEEYDLVPGYIPTQNEGDQLHLTAEMGVYAKANSGSVVMSTCENVELAVRYLDWWYSEEGSLLTNWGVEGVTFEIVNGEKQYTDLILKNEAGLNVAQMMYLGGTSGASFQYDNTTLKQQYTDLQYEACQVWTSNVDTEWNMPVISLTANETQTFNDHYGDIGTFLDENIVKFITGDRSMDEYADFQNTLQEMGIEDCIAIYQAAYERYMSR